MMMPSLLFRRLVAGATLSIAAAPAVHAQVAAPPAPAAVEPRVTVDPSLAAIDSTLTAQYPITGPGAAVLAVRDGRVLMRKAYGSADVELGVPMRPEHVFRLGSMTKQFTAVATLMLADEGKLALSDDITRFFPDYPMRGHHITVEHLLTHTSGIRSYTSIPGYVAGMRRDLTVTELVASFRDQPMDFAPGERWSYDNSGYALLGAIIEKVSGMTYADFLRTRIFEPLGMRSTRYETEDALIPGRVEGYEREQDGSLRRASYLSMTQPYAAGSLVSNVDDLLLWNQAVAAGRMLKPETWRRAFAAHPVASGLSSGYGYGWFIGRADGRPTIEHSGDINGFSTNGLWIPGDRLLVIVLANHERGPSGDPTAISLRIASRVLGPAPAPAAVTVTPAALDAFVGVYRIDNVERRIVTREGETLYTQRGRRPRQALRAIAADEFVIAPADLRVRFVRRGGAVTGLMMRPRLGPEELLPRTDETVAAALAPPAAKVTVPAAVLSSYAGEYEMAPGVVMTIRVEGTGLKARLTAQGEVTLVPETETRFLVQEVPAAVVFERDSTGAVTRLILQQGGREQPARRITAARPVAATPARRTGWGWRRSPAVAVT
jgi:CubicO group peptidase (beta-lactamase class C family)